MNSKAGLALRGLSAISNERDTMGILLCHFRSGKRDGILTAPKGYPPGVAHKSCLKVRSRTYHPSRHGLKLHTQS